VEPSLDLTTTNLHTEKKYEVSVELRRKEALSACKMDTIEKHDSVSSRLDLRILTRALGGKLITSIGHNLI
jgi:hypothetical protein